MRLHVALSGSLAILALAGCGSTCVAKGDRVEVSVASTDRLNNSGQGAQHVRFQAWAVRDAVLFAKMASERPDDLASAQNSEKFPQLGKAFDLGEWMKPASERSGTLDVGEDSLYTHVGLIALYTRGTRTAIVPIDCASGRPEYKVTKPVHAVRFTMDETNVGPSK